ncbi:MAG: hypothetical protein AAGD07_23840 [Planctomycetota bacterium]
MGHRIRYVDLLTLLVVVTGCQGEDPSGPPVTVVRSTHSQVFQTKQPAVAIKLSRKWRMDAQGNAPVVPFEGRREDSHEHRLLFRPRFTNQETIVDGYSRVLTVLHFNPESQMPGFPDSVLLLIRGYCQTPGCTAEGVLSQLIQRSVLKIDDIGSQNTFVTPFYEEVRSNHATWVSGRVKVELPSGDFVQHAVTIRGDEVIGLTLSSSKHSGDEEVDLLRILPRVELLETSRVR